MADIENRYIFHWLSSSKLDGLLETGVLKPYWRHFLIEQERFAKGISCAIEPMLWHPDNELPREPCLVIDLEKVSCPIHHLDSSDVYHFTKEILRAKRRKEDISALIEAERIERKFIFGSEDEIFIEGQLDAEWIVAIGFQSDHQRGDLVAQASAGVFASARSVPLLDMTDWVVGDPGVTETDGIVAEAINAMSVAPVQGQALKI